MRRRSTSSSSCSTTPWTASTRPRSGAHVLGNPGAQHCFDPNISYEPSLEIFLDRINADVWTIESKHNNHQLLPSFAPHKGKLNKKIAVGMISHRALQVETPEEVAADIRTALEHIAPEHLVPSSDCGFGRQGVSRPIALYKAAALAQGANIVRGELGPRPRLSAPRIRRSRSMSRRRRRTRDVVAARSTRGAHRLLIRNGFVVSMDPQIGEIPPATCSPRTARSSRSARGSAQRTRRRSTRRA